MQEKKAVKKPGNYCLRNCLQLPDGALPERNVSLPGRKYRNIRFLKNHINRLDQECDEILVLEEGAPMVEEMLKGFFAKKERQLKAD